LVTDVIQRFPTSSKRSLARKLHAEYPQVFSSEEHARGHIKCYTGTSGVANKKAYKTQLQMKSNFSGDNPYGLPKSDAKPAKHFVMPTANNNILVLSDIHLPYHDINAVSIALDYGKKHEVNTILLLGDILDCHKASFHEQDPRKRSLADEFETAREFLDILKREFPKANIFFKEGNHEKRWERYLRVHAPAALDMAEFRLDVLLKLREKGITWIPNEQVIKIGKLYAIHGNEYKGGGGINAARTLWLRAGESTICGDKHKTQNMIKTNISGKVHGTWVIGCLCELNPEYLSLNEWNLGYAHIIVHKGGEFEVHNKQIINGKVF
jgi:predicted phosphodiesterase